jgi:hypothetical protein
MGSMYIDVLVPRSLAAYYRQKAQVRVDYQIYAPQPSVGIHSPFTDDHTVFQEVAGRYRPWPEFTAAASDSEWEPRATRTDTYEANQWRNLINRRSKALTNSALG